MRESGYEKKKKKKKKIITNHHPSQFNSILYRQRRSEMSGA